MEQKRLEKQSLEKQSLEKQSLEKQSLEKQSLEKQSLEINKQLTELDGFLKSIEHVNKLLDNFNNLDTVDENDLYDLIYVRKNIEKQLENNISNKDIVKSLNSILDRAKNIISLLSKEEIQRIESHKLKNTSQLDKAKYGDKHKLKGLKNLKHKIKGNVSLKKALGKYLVTRLSMGIALIIVIILTSSVDIATKLTSDVIAQEQTVEVKQQSNIEDTAKELEFIPSTNVTETWNELMEPMKAILRMLSIMIYALFTVCVTLDIFYIAIGYNFEKNNETNILSEGSKLISSQALNIMKELEDEEDYLSIDTQRRVIVAETLIDNLMFSLNKQIKEMTEQGLDVKDLENTVDKLTKIKNKSLTRKDLDRIEVLAEGEIIYWQNKDTIHIENDI